MSSTPTRRRRNWLAALSLLAAATSAVAPPAMASANPTRGDLPIYLDTHYSFAERAADLVSRMTLSEKVQQLRTNSAPAIPRLAVQQYTYWSEGQHGLNVLGANTNHGTVGGGVRATSFPTNFASTMSWDPKLIYQETTAISDEARGELDKSLWGVGQNNIGPDQSEYGSLTYWAPTVNLDRDPRWGRTDEAFGEDPYLVGQMAGAFVDGYQGETPAGQPTSPYLKVAATAKHFALNDVENNRHADSSDTTDANLRDYYTAQFKSLVEDSHVSGLMTSYNAINGTPSPANTYTTNELAQRTYGFTGYTTSDCGAVGDVYASASHNWAPPGWTTSTANGGTVWTNSATGQQLAAAAGGQAYALRAGTQLNCTGAEETVTNIEQAIGAGVLSEGVIDNALVHLFTLRMQTGEFDPPSKVPYTRIGKEQIQSPAHQALAETVAANSLVLLKNDQVPDGSGTLLPADPATLNNVVIVGDLANKVTLGGYSGSPSLQVSAVQGITSAITAANPAATVTFDSCGTSTRATAAAACSAQTLAAIKTADLVVVFVGTDGQTAGESKDRTTLAMPGNYDSLIDQVSAAGNHRIALAIQSDGPVTIDNVQNDFPAIVFSGYNGESQGSALADVLFGKQNPGGHLDFTWYKDDSQLPDMKNYGLTPSQTDGIGRTYQYFTGAPTYPFGYGLSYTTFRYSHVTAPASATADGRTTVQVDVTNTGSVPGASVVQLYAATPFGVPGVELPRERLAGFQKTRTLLPGQSQHIAIPVQISDLSLWDQQKQKEVVYDGKYVFGVGTDSSRLVGSATVRVRGTITPKVQYVTVQPDQVDFAPGQTLDLTGKNPWIKDDTVQAAQHVPADNIVEAVNNDESFVDLTHARVAYRSSNPKVASVSPSGNLTTLAPGVATISVTVNHVTGTTPVVVKQPFALSASALAQPGSTFTATTTLPNPAGAGPLRNVAMTLTAPEGWAVHATSPASFATVPAGTTARTTWQVTVPADAPAGTQQLAATATFTSANGRGNSSDAASVALPYPSMQAAYDNVGISDDANPSAGNLDGGGASYSAQALAAATPSLTPGGTVVHDGLTFTWPAAQPGTPDNVQAGGQTIAISGAGGKLGLLGTGDYGAASGTATITYTDGTAQSFNLEYADWWSNAPAPGGDILATTAYINNATGQQNQKVSVYYASVTLQPGKEIRYLTLPNISQGTGTTLAMHIFAVAVGG